MQQYARFSRRPVALRYFAVSSESLLLKRNTYHSRTTKSRIRSQGRVTTSRNCYHDGEQYSTSQFDNSNITKIINRLSFSTWSCGSKDNININKDKSTNDHVDSSRIHNETEATSSETILNVLQERINRGELRYDKAQERAAKRLARLQKALLEYNETKHKQQLLQMDSMERHESDKEKSQTIVKTDADRPREQSNAVTNINQDENQKQKLQVEKKEKVLVPRGLFLHGSVGTGKSMLMDEFYKHVPLEKKRRVHFHSFMQDVHRRIHELKQHDLKTRGRSFHVDYVSKPLSTSRESKDATKEKENNKDTSTKNNNEQPYQNPIDRVAHQLATEVTLLCFDEFQVTDVADALILSQLFSTLFARGTVMVATSNRPPCDLYEGGINRGYFLPFIDLLQQYCIVHPIKSSIDYRQLCIGNQDDDRWKNHFFIVPKEGQDDEQTNNGTTTRTCQIVFDQLLQQNGQDASSPTASSIELQVGFNRSIQVPQGDPNGVVCWFDFEDLCCTELGSLDYRTIAQHFSVVLLENVPILTLKEHDQARRFITLVDELYEGKCAVLCSTTLQTKKQTSTIISNPEDLFINGYELPNTSVSENVSGIELKVGEAFGIDVAQSNGKTAGELASVRELSFAFQRASSRLTEMCSRQWWDKVLQNQ